MPSPIQLNIIYPTLANFKGWQCGNSFISSKSRCFTDPITGRKLKQPLTYQQYKKEQDRAIAAQKQGKSLSDKDKYYIKQLENKSIQNAIKSTGATKLIPGNIGSVDLHQKKPTSSLIC